MSTPLVTSSPHSLSRGDRWGLWVFIAAGAVITAVTAVQGVGRIIQVLSPGPVPVQVQFTNTPGSIGYGTDSTLPIDVYSGVIQAMTLPSASIAAGVIGPVATILTTAAISACLVLLALSVLRGRIFSKRNSRLVTGAVITGLVGFSLANLCSTMLANGAVAWATERALDNIVFSFEPAVYILGAFAGGLIATVFTVGERLQRDTEGLV